MLKSFSSMIDKIGINPFVGMPDDVLRALFDQAGKTEGPIPVRGTVNGKRFKQTLVKCQGVWRLYMNGEMRRAAGVDVGDLPHIKLEFDPVPRLEQQPSVFVTALSKSEIAKAASERLRPSRPKEILRHLNNVKTERSLERNIEKIILHLTGKEQNGLGHLLRNRD